METIKVVSFEIIDHGVEHGQYFQGCGTAFTKYTDAFTGIGNSPAEALEDALELIGARLEFVDPQLGAEYQDAINGLLALTDDRVSPMLAKHQGDLQWEDNELHYRMSIRIQRAE